MKKYKKLKSRRFKKMRSIYKFGKFVVFIANSASLFFGIASFVKFGSKLISDKKHK